MGARCPFYAECFVMKMKNTFVELEQFEDIYSW